MNRLLEKHQSMFMLPEGFITSQNRVNSSLCFLRQTYTDFYRINIDSFMDNNQKREQMDKSFAAFFEKLRKFCNKVFDHIGYSNDFPFFAQPTTRMLSMLDRRMQRQAQTDMVYPKNYMVFPLRGGRPRGRGRGRGGPRAGNRGSRNCQP